MRSQSEIYYEARIALGGAALLPILLLPAYAIYCWYCRHVDLALPEMVHQQIFTGFELIMPLAAALLAAHLITLEPEAGFDELREVYPQPRTRLPLLRIGEAVGLTALSVAISLLLLAFVGVPYSLVTALVPALPPTLWLMGFTVLVGRLGRSYWVAAAAAVVYWVFEVFSRGIYTGSLALFLRTWPTDRVSYGLNRASLLALGALACALACEIGVRRSFAFGRGKRN